MFPVLVFLKSRAAYYGPFAPPLSPVIARSNILRLRLRECLFPPLAFFHPGVLSSFRCVAFSPSCSPRPPGQRPHARRVRHAAMRSRAREGGPQHGGPSISDVWTEVGSQMTTTDRPQEMWTIGGLGGAKLQNICNRHLWKETLLNAMLHAVCSSSLSPLPKNNMQNPHV